MRYVMTRVFPLPAPARISTGPSVVSTASRCCGFNSSRNDKRKWLRGALIGFYRRTENRNSQDPHALQRGWFPLKGMKLCQAAEVLFVCCDHPDAHSRRARCNKSVIG